MDDQLHTQAKTLVQRLGRLSADSTWAHRASGVRAALDKLLNQGSTNAQQLEKLIQLGFEVLEKAAQRIPGDPKA